MDDRMHFRSANARIDALVADPLIADDVKRYAEQRQERDAARNVPPPCRPPTAHEAYEVPLSD